MAETEGRGRRRSNLFATFPSPTFYRTLPLFLQVLWANFIQVLYCFGDKTNILEAYKHRSAISYLKLPDSHCQPLRPGPARNASPIFLGKKLHFAAFLLATVSFLLYFPPYRWRRGNWMRGAERGKKFARYPVKRPPFPAFGEASQVIERFPLLLSLLYGK